MVGGESGIKSNRHAVDLLHGFSLLQLYLKEV